MPGLQHIEDDGERCRLCGRLAAGPCASCHRPVCGDCCVLSDGGVKVWAICLTCERDGGRSMRRGWLGLVAWIGLVILALLALVAALLLFARHG
jgi:hypothetical protein